MLAPEVWKFQPPSCAQQLEAGNLSDAQECVDFCVSTHFFNHSVSVVIPSKEKLPQKILAGPSADADYYKVKSLPVAEFISYDFISNFVNKGKVSALSIGTLIEADNCVCLTPSGVLILNLDKVDYERLGLEGKPSFYCRQKLPSRYIVKIDFTEEFFKPNKKIYERAVKCLLINHKLTMDFILTWDPPDADTCPSSIGAYFESLGYDVAIGNRKFSQSKSVDSQVPNNLMDCEQEEVFEWLGAVCLGADLERWFDSSTEFIIEDDTSNKPLQTLQWTGLFSCQQIDNFISTLRRFMSSESDVPWVSIHVQGFEDSAVAWKLNEHFFHQTGENSYTIVFSPDEKFSLCKTVGGNRKSKAHSK